jgi:hypothetical protein
MGTGLADARVARRSWAVSAVIGLLIFLGITALLGGFELVFGVWGVARFPADWVHRLPLIDSWLVPGLVLGVGFGVGSLITAYGLVRRPRCRLLAWVERLTGCHWSWVVTVVIGTGQLIWIGLEVGYLPARSWLEGLYGAIGVLLAALPWCPPVRAYLRLSHGEGSSGIQHLRGQS